MYPCRTSLMRNECPQVCAFDGSKWEHYRTRDYWVAVGERAGEAPELWIQILVSVLLLALSALFSGLNLSLLALDPVELQVLQNSGTDREQRYARKIESVRRHGKYGKSFPLRLGLRFQISV